MRFVVPGLTLLAMLGLAACANNPNRPTDVGSMQTPAPAASGVLGTNRPGADTGSMAQPAASGNSGLRFQPDALGSMGSMQSPNSSQGNLRRSTP
jgi:hypothetical protein